MTVRKNFIYWVRRGFLYLVLIATSALMMVPFYWSVTTSFKLEQFVFASPPQWWPEPGTFQHYIDVFTQFPFARYFSNSVFVSGLITLGNVFFDTLAAYAFAKLRFPGRDKIFFLLLMGLMVPFQVNLIPMYRLMSILKWLDTYLALIVPTLTSITGIFLLRQFMKSIPDEILELSAH